MDHRLDDLSRQRIVEDSRESAGVLFTRIREEFREKGLLGQSLMLEYEGIRYRITCDESAFIVYRVNENSGPRHHVPGWPVCLVNADTIFEECGSQDLGNDHCACGLDVDKWLDLVVRQCNP